MSATDVTEALFTDVSQVQKELEKFSVERAVDANEIYELLETHSFRTDRVQFVASHLLGTLGLRTAIGKEDIINVSDDSEDDHPMDGFYMPSQESSNDTIVLDLTVPNQHSISESSATETFNGNSNSSSDYTEALGASEIDVYPSTSLFQNKIESISQLHEMESAASPGAGASIPESNTVSSSTAEDTSTKHNSEPSNSNDVPPPAHQNDDFICDVNNNDPNNNTEYEFPVQVEDKEEQHFTVRDSDHSEIEFEDDDDARCKLLEEAKLVHSIVPKQSFKQIYSYLEANVDYKSRVDIALHKFLESELEPEVCDSAMSATGSVGCKLEIPCQHSVLEIQNLSDPQPCTSSARTVVIEEKNVVKANVVPKPRETKYAVRELCPSIQKNAKINTKGSTLNKQKGKKFEKGKVSKYHQAVQKSYKKMRDAIQAFENINPGISSEMKIISSATDPKLPSIRAVSSTSASRESAEQNSVVLNNPGVVGIASTINFNKQTKPADANTSNTARLAWIVEVPQTLDTPIPSSSTERVKLISSTSTAERQKRKMESVDSESSPNKNKIGDFDQNYSLPHTDIATNEITLTEKQLKCRTVLMEMFPGADPQYLTEQCRTVDTEESMFDMVAELLDSGDYPHRQTPEKIPIEPETGPSTSSSMSDKERIEMQYDTLVAILPNADPVYLRTTCERIGNDENAMKTFVTQALETKIYPTREDFLKRQEALALQKKYTEQFSIEGFLEILPDPFKYFLEEKKNDKKLAGHALKYLKQRYLSIPDITLRRAFMNNRYNLTLTCQELDNFRGRLRVTRRQCECRIPAGVSIPFLQEVAFIENRRKIEKYLKNKADEKKRAFEEAKAEGALLECGCCFDNEVMATDMAACNEGHLFCKDCVKKAAEVQIGDGKTTFPCLTDCVAEFSLKTVQDVLKPSVFSMMLRRKQLEEVKAAGIEDLETCPFCDFASIPPHEDKVFRCLNPDCMRESCRKCKEPNHVPLRCHEVEKADEVKARTYIENRMTEALVRTCWKCGKKFVKESGCNKMTCMCGAMMCYICRLPVKDYTHFNGQGGDAHHKCPLYSNNDVIHVDAVREEAEKAKTEMKARNPSLKLKHDPTRILPGTKGLKVGHHWQHHYLEQGHHHHHQQQHHLHHYHHHHHHQQQQQLQQHMFPLPPPPLPPFNFADPVAGGIQDFGMLNRTRGFIPFL